MLSKKASSLARPFQLSVDWKAVLIIRSQDLLTTSPTAGHAMRADDPRPGAILGKALEELYTGTGMIRVLVTLR